MKTDRLLQWPLVGVLVLLLAGPLLFQVSIWMHLWPRDSKIRFILKNHGLRGVVIDAPKAQLGFREWIHGDFQKAAETCFNRQFLGRDILIKSINQIYYTLFSESYKSTIVVGSHHSLYEYQCIETYKHLGVPPNADTMTALGGEIAELNDRLKAKGVCFCFVFTASKASIDPEDIPSAFQDRMPGQRSDYSMLKDELTKRGVPYVDGREIIEQECMKMALPPFASGGTHWNNYCAYLVSQALVEKLKSLSGDPLSPPKAERIEIVPTPTSRDCDLYYLMNIWEPPHYSSYVIKYGEEIPAVDPRENMTLVGGSFAGSLLSDLTRSLSRITFLYYYKLQAFNVAPGIYTPILTGIDYDKVILSSRFLVLEINETAFGNYKFYDEFLKDALVTLRQ